MLNLSMDVERSARFIALGRLTVSMIGDTDELEKSGCLRPKESRRRKEGCGDRVWLPMRVLQVRQRGSLYLGAFSDEINNDS